MTRAIRQTTILLALLMVAGAWALPATADSWLEVRTPRVRIISNAGARQATDLARRLDGFVTAFSATVDVPPSSGDPLPVIAFRDDASFALFRPRQNGRTLNLSGYFQRADDENIIALSLQTPPDDTPYHAIFHEYAHALTARFAGVWPLWLYEGLAEFYATTSVDAARASVGAPVLPHLRRLRDTRLLPLPALFAIAGTSSMFDEGRQNIFYAESWALVHYLAASDEGRRTHALTRVLDALAAGDNSERALTEALAVDMDTLERNVRRYIGDERYVLLTVPLAHGARDARDAAHAQRVSDAEANVWQAIVLMRFGRAADAAPFLDRARALDPNAPRLDESLGFIALNTGRYDDAARHLKAAIAKDPDNALAHYYYAETLRREVMDQGRALPVDVARAMVDPLRSAIRLRPSFARACYLLGYAYFVIGDQLAEAIDLLRTAIRLAPPHRAAMLTLAFVELKVGAYAEARANAQAIVDAPDASAQLKADARRAVDSADRGLAGR